MRRVTEEATAGSGKVDFGDHAPGSLAWVSPAQAPAAEDRVVTTAFQFLVDPAGLTPAKARELGRAIGAQARSDELVDYLDAFSHLGLGRLLFRELESDRYQFHGTQLRGSDRPNAASCALALGFVEGAVSAMTGHDALGAEIQCRSRGHERCVFTVRSRAPP